MLKRTLKLDKYRPGMVVIGAVGWGWAWLGRLRWPMAGLINVTFGR